MRVILYTGKGGVGKTTIASATGLLAAELGYKTIILSADPAHSLADSFDITLKGEVEQVAPNLWIRETIIHQTIAKKWQKAREWLLGLLAREGFDGLRAEEIAYVPGMEELANLLYVAAYYEGEEGEEKYDVIIVDCAPTGETLRLVSFPDALSWWLDRMFAVEERRTASRASGDILEALGSLFDDLCRIRNVLTDPEHCSIRLVLTPEKMVIKETQRSVTYFDLYGFFPEMVIVNKLFPEDLGGRFSVWRESQQKYCRMIEESFSPLPIRTLPLFEQEVVGMSMLKRVAEALFGDQDPTQFFFRGHVQEIKEEKEGPVLILSLPFLTKEEISITQVGDELILRGGKIKRNIILPPILAEKKAREARYEQDKLRIRFE
jgi:arsenite-transporting ATPase